MLITIITIIFPSSDASCENEKFNFPLHKHIIILEQNALHLHFLLLNCFVFATPCSALTFPKQNTVF